MKKIIIGVLTLAAIALVWSLSSNNNNKVTKYPVANGQISQNVSTDNGKQIIEVSAKGGYTPRVSTAKADTPTILRIKTSSTFDCSSALRIPSLGYSKNLPPSGTTDIEIPAQAAGSTLKALCSMGMYNFSVEFKS